MYSVRCTYGGHGGRGPGDGCHGPHLLLAHALVDVREGVARNGRHHAGGIDHDAVGAARHADGRGAQRGAIDGAGARLLEMRKMGSEMGVG